jgi:predicted outer membrane repeat protein
MRRPIRLLPWLSIVVYLISGNPLHAMTLLVPDQVPTVAAAVDSATFGDVIRIRPGIYAVRDVTLKDGIVIEPFSSSGAEQVTLDAGGTGRIFLGFNLSAATRLIGMTFINGSGGDPDDGANTGGGALVIYNSALEITGCTFRDNHSLRTYADGGALYFFESAPVIEHCTFTNNAARDAGGAIFFNDCGSTPAVSDCVFTSNQAAWGGGAIAANGSNPQISYCQFTDNYASTAGGGYIQYEGSSGNLAWCIFARNSSGYGGAIASSYVLTVDHCTLYGNSGTIAGGGIAINGMSFFDLANTIVSFSGEGAGLYFHDDGDLAAVVTNSDVYGNEGGNWAGAFAGFLGSAGNIELDPGFCDAVAEDFGLCGDSPCLADDHHALIGGSTDSCGPCLVDVPSLQIAVLKNPARSRNLTILVKVAHGSPNAPAVTVNSSAVVVSAIGEHVYLGHVFLPASVEAATILAEDTTEAGTGSSQAYVVF